MSVTAVLIAVVEAAAACGPLAPARLGGGAEAVRAILDVEEQGLQPSAPILAGLREAPRRLVDGAGTEANRQEADPAATRCEIVPTVIA